MVKRAGFALAAYCALIAPCGAGDEINYLDPPAGQFVDDWMIVELAGAKAGYAHSTMTRTGDRIDTRMLFFFRIGRAEQNIEIRIVQTTTETLDGKPLTFGSSLLMGATETKTLGVIKDGQANITTSQFGFDTHQTGRVPDTARMAWGLFRTTIEKGLEPGTKYELEVYEPLMLADGTIKARVTVEGRETIEHAGKTRTATKVNTTMLLPAGQVDSVSYVDDNGQVLRGQTNLAGIAMTLTVVDKDTALAEFDAPEFFMDTLVKVDRRIDRDSARRIRYKLKVVGPDQKMPHLPETPMQRPGERTERSAVVEVRRLDHEALRHAENGPTPESMVEYLAASPSINSKDDAIVRMAADAAGDANDPYAVADKLRVYVSRIITEKNLNVGFATASEVCRNRVGDCTEHAVLLAALGRARGIPARIVVGLAYLPTFVGVHNVFGFHMWTQFYVGGQWVDFDAALQETDCSPARIALATSSLKDSAIGEIALAIMDVVRGLEIEVESVESR